MLFAGPPQVWRANEEKKAMESSARHSFRLAGAACLTLTGLVALAAGVGVAASPWHLEVCARRVAESCCPQFPPPAPPMAARQAALPLED